MKILLITKTILFTLLSISQVMSVAAVREYRSNLENADWTIKSKKQYFCQLSQTIPYYGEVNFIHKSGQDMKFNLSSQDLFLNDTRVTVMAEPAPWRHDGASFELGKFSTKQGHSPVNISSPVASRMFQQLENGLVTSLRYHDLADQKDIIDIAVSPIKLRKQLKAFRECESTLLEYDPEFIVDFNIYFATNKDILTERAKKNLIYLLKHLTIDTKQIQIRIDAHADSRGRRRFNDKLSVRRGDAILDYLLKKGAKPEMIYLKTHGERMPQHDNETKVGRAKNRHAQIQLLTTPVPPPEVEVKVDKKPEEFIRTDNLSTPVPSFINMEHLIKQ